MGNLFLEHRIDVMKLDSTDIADEWVVETVCYIEKIGQKQYEKVC